MVSNTSRTKLGHRRPFHRRWVRFYIRDGVGGLCKHTDLTQSLTYNLIKLDCDKSQKKKKEREKLNRREPKQANPIKRFSYFRFRSSRVSCSSTDFFVIVVDLKESKPTTRKWGHALDLLGEVGVHMGVALGSTSAIESPLYAKRMKAGRELEQKKKKQKKKNTKRTTKMTMESLTVELRNIW